MAPPHSNRSLTQNRGANHPPVGAPIITACVPAVFVSLMDLMRPFPVCDYRIAGIDQRTGNGRGNISDVLIVRTDDFNLARVVAQTI